jgi:hypothetical protein
MTRKRKRLKSIRSMAATEGPGTRPQGLAIADSRFALLMAS